MKELADQIKECKKCELHRSCNKKIVGKGSFTPEILFIGGIPTEKEDKAGAPFLHEEGRLLKKWTDSLGLTKYAAVKAIRCRTPGDRDPTEEEIKTCNYWLKKQIKKLNPQTIVTFGETAFKSVSNSEFDYDKFKDSIFLSDDYGLIHVMAHPSEYLKNGWDESLTKLKGILNGEASYVPLHVHTMYSFGDGCGRISDLVATANEERFEALAITDHGTISGWHHFQAECDKNSIKPIFGVELYVVEKYSSEVKELIELTKDEEEKERLKKLATERRHLVVLAKNQTGIKNIFKLVTISNENLYYKPVITIKDIITHGKGLILLSACTQGVVARNLWNDEAFDYDMACNFAKLFKSYFGEDFYLELQPHFDYDQQHPVNKNIIKLSEELEIPLVLTTDVHYIIEDAKDLHSTVKAIAYHKPFGEYVFDGETHCLLSPRDLIDSATRTQVPIKIAKEALENTLKIADQCNARMTSYGRVVPEFKIPEIVEG